MPHGMVLAASSWEVCYDPWSRGSVNTQQTELFGSGKTIFEEGEPGEKMYIVRQGIVQLSVSGKPIVTVGTGGIFGEMALIDRKPRSATAKAKTDCELIPINHSRFFSLVQQNPAFAIEVMKVLAERLRMMDAALVGSAHFGKSHRPATTV